MQRPTLQLFALAATAWVAACTNPTVDPEVDLAAKATALGRDGMPLAGATVKLVRFFHDSEIKFLEPSVDDLLACDDADCGYDSINLEIGVVREGVTAADGTITFNFKGADIAAEGGITDAMGRVEVSNLVLLIQTATGEAVLTYDHLFQQTDVEWGAGSLQLWNSQATADITNVLTTGLVDFDWAKLTAPSNRGRNFYRLEIGGASSAHLIIRCQAGTADTLGGCSDRGEKLSRSVSAFSIFQFYSDAGRFSAWIQGNGTTFRFLSSVMVTGQIQMPPRNEVGGFQVFAVSATGDQDLTNGPATDGMIGTRETLTGKPKQIYIHVSDSVSDLGVLNAVVADAYISCATIEFTTNDPNDLAGAKAITSWNAQGKFCGGNGNDNILSAVINFQPQQTAGWARITLAADQNENGADPHFMQIGEVAVYQE